MLRRFAEDIRSRYADLLEGETPREGRPRSSSDETTARTILRRLGHRGEERGIAPVEHVRQTETWDCGLACVLMILRWLSRNDDGSARRAVGFGDEAVASGSEASARRKLGEGEIAWMMDLVATDSIWTVDLVFLLERLSSGDGPKASEGGNRDAPRPRPPESRAAPRRPPPPPSSSWSYLFCSARFGVDESYGELGYYKDKFTSDELRVKNLFDVARKRNLPLLRTSHLSLESLVDVVSRRGVAAIVLLDNGALLGDSSASYSGHYVVLCGISGDAGDVGRARLRSPGGEDDAHDYAMVVKNPGSRTPTDLVTPSAFERAWRAEGTDEDVVFVARHEEGVRDR